MACGTAKTLGLSRTKRFLGFDAQVRLQSAVDAVDPFVVPFEVLHVAQVQVAQAKAPGTIVVRQADQPVCRMSGL